MSTESKTEEFWSGSFGDSYTARNRVDWRARIPFWDRLVAKYGFRSVYEVGCNAGWNLSAIKHAIHGYNVQVYGREINEKAAEQAKYAGINVQHERFEITPPASYTFGLIGTHELVFTSGVLIHIAPEDLKRMMQAIIDVSCDYVLAIEYEAEQEEEVEYRGHAGRLWKRDYGKLYQDMGLTLVDKFDAGEGFDNCTAWLLRK